MANFKVGQIVKLRSGKWARIKAITVNDPMAYRAQYLVSLQPEEKSMRVNGLQIDSWYRKGPRDDLAGKTLDGYQVTGITYGADSLCTLCNNGRESHEVFETELSRAAAVEVLALVMKFTDPSRPGRVGGALRDARFMLGVLLVPGREILVAASGDKTPDTLIQALAGDPRFRLCSRVPTLPLICRGGAEIKPLHSCKVERDGNRPLLCAAPKLVDYANRHAYTMPYHMSEVWFDGKTFRRAIHRTPVMQPGAQLPMETGAWLTSRLQRRIYTDHGETRESCSTCKGVLPLLLCGAKPQARGASSH